MDSVLIALIAALIIALANGYILIQQEEVKITDIQANIVLIQKQQTQILNYLITKR